FTLPRLFTAGPFDPKCTLSQLVLRNPGLQQQIRACLNGSPGRLEFFCVEESERRVAEALGIPAYCNFDVAIPLSRKPAFKRFFDQIGLRTPRWLSCRGAGDLAGYGEALLASGPFLIKAQDGTGGIACGGMARIQTAAGLASFIHQQPNFGDEFMIETIVDSAAEVSIHWEMLGGDQARLINIFEQLTRNFGYAGAVWPPQGVSRATREQICSEAETILWPALRDLGALGFFCCDIIVDKSGVPWWVDFNPRKGAILYVHDLVQRLSQQHAGASQGYFRHEHFPLPERAQTWSFAEVRQVLSDLLIPGQPAFAVISNPGVIPYGYCDVTGISWASAKAAEERFQGAKHRLLRG
ncbi:MAG: hypothetical protein Q8L21_03380, partial [Candidatus Komeilibacteria bacterium]|nr:hypothetical protein [Candidatus Komeilibacteria bacterium]